MGFLDLPGLQYFYNKYVKGLKSHAFRDPANNLTTTESGYALDARQGKALNDKVTQLNSALAIKTTVLTSADPNYFQVNGAHCFHIAGFYIININVNTLKSIAKNHDAGEGRGASFLYNLPFEWGYNVKFPATVNENMAMNLEAYAGESTLHISVNNPAMNVGARIISNFCITEELIS